MDCEQLNATVSWQRSDLAAGYVASFASPDGRRASCVAGEADSSCHVSELTCGAAYRVWVTALGRGHNSSDSTAVSLTTGKRRHWDATTLVCFCFDPCGCPFSPAPCMPAELHVEVECSSDVAAVVSWNASRGAANFSLTAIISGALRTLCTTQGNACNVTGLSCGETYNLSLTASNDRCSLAAPTHANLTAREC